MTATRRRNHRMRRAGREGTDEPGPLDRHLADLARGDAQRQRTRRLALRDLKPPEGARRLRAGRQ